jgi:hypothetical protein
VRMRLELKALENEVLSLMHRADSIDIEHDLLINAMTHSNGSIQSLIDLSGDLQRALDAFVDKLVGLEKARIEELNRVDI